MDGFEYRVASLTRNLGRPPVFVHNRDLIARGFQFASVYSVREEDARAISQTAGTAAGFKGVIWSQRLWIDFDETAPADRAESFLKQEGLDYVSYDTGNRGRHFGILRHNGPSHTLPAQDKLWAKEFMPGCDLGLYWHLHLLRLPGATHEKTGRKKVCIGRFPTGKALILPPIPGDTEVVESKLPSSPSARESIFKSFEVLSRLGGPDPGTSARRHLVVLAKALANDAQAPPDVALFILLEVNRGLDIPKEDNEIHRIVRWAYGLEG